MRQICRMQTGRLVCAALLLVTGSRAQAQALRAVPGAQGAAIVTTPEVVNFDALRAQAADLLKQAAAGSGSASTVLSQYRGHYTMLSARTRNGVVEVHKKLADFLMVIDGEGIELTGGTVVDGMEGVNGEIRGTRLQGATPHTLHKGDMIHIPAGTPHQAIQAPGKSIVLFVIKVQEPEGSAS